MAAPAGRPLGIAGPARPTESTLFSDGEELVVEAAGSLERSVTAAVATSSVLHFTPKGWNDLPSDIFILISRFLPLSDALGLEAVSKKWRSSVASWHQAILHSHALDFDRTVDAKRACQLYQTQNIIGEAAWKRTGRNPGPIPLLSAATATHLESPCPFWPARGRIIDTHLLVWIPASVTRTIDGRLETVPVTLANLPNIIPGARYQCMSGALAQSSNEAPVRGRWLLVPKELMPGSTNQTFAQQQAFVAARGREMPHAVDIAVALFMKQFCSPGTYLLHYNPMMYTRCSETVQFMEGGNHYCLLVGGFSPNGLHVSHYYFEDGSYGVVGPAEVQVLGT